MKWIVLTGLTLLVVLFPLIPGVADEPGDSSGMLLVEDDNDFSSFARADFIADNYIPLIGEPIELTLTVHTEPGVDVIDWPEFPEDWRPFMVREVGEVEVDEQPDGSATHRQWLQVYVWRPGDFETPETYIGYRLQASGEVFRIPARSIFFSVPSVLETEDLNLLTIHPYRPPVSFFYIPPWLVIVVVVGAGGVFWLGRRWWREHRPRRREPVATPKTPAQITLDALERLHTLDSSPAAMCIQMADMLRMYIQRRFDIPAQDRTTIELMAALEDAGQFDKRHRDELRRLLEQADLVKFAGLQPDQTTIDHMLTAARRWITRVDAPLESQTEEIVENEVAQK
jgi:hypothetical protein